MSAQAEPRTASRVLVDQLSIHGVSHVFTVPGESFLGVLDALRDSDIALTVCRQEGGAAMMADAVGKATGQPGVCFVTRGPGAANATAGVHVAWQDSTPMVMFVGQVDRAVRGRDAWQEIDCEAVFGSMTKWAVEIDDPSRIPEYVARAFHIAVSGRPGPVVIGVPRDLLAEPVACEDASPIVADQPAPWPAEIAQLKELLNRAAAPILLVGGSRWDESARASITRFAERFAMPVATAYRRLPLFDALHPNYAGDLGLAANPRLVARFRDADLVMAVGSRLSEVTTQGYTLFDASTAGTKLVHVHPGREELGRVFQSHLAINATPGRFATALDDLVPFEDPPWRDSVAMAHSDYIAWSEVANEQPGDVNLGDIMIWLRANLPAGAILCNGAGNYAGWLHRYFRFRDLVSHVAPTSASMGYGVPAAVAMQRLFPDRRVVSINGDGDFLMNGQEFATAVHYALPITVVVLDNSAYGTIRMHQEREYPGRTIGTDLTNPDFAAYARAFGGFGATVTRTADFPSAFQTATASRLPAIVHVKYDKEAITPGQTLSGVRAAALAARV
jgi:acetolactate synthase-1/2/3 large subunit